MARVVNEYNVGNAQIKIDPLVWIVYEKYEIISAFSYIKKYGQAAIDKLEHNYPSFFQDMCDELGDTNVIAPIGEGKTIYNPLEQDFNLFLSFAKLYHIEETSYPTNEQILEWVQAHGLLFATPSSGRVPIYGDETTKGDFDSLISKYHFFEDAMYQVVKTYTPFVGALELWTEEAAKLQNGAIELSKQPTNNLLIPATHFAANPKDIAYMCDITEINRIDSSSIKELHDILARGLLSRLAGYHNKISPVFSLAQNSAKEYGLVPSWRVPDLWTTLILQLANFIFTKQNLKKCVHCGNLFYAKDPRMKFCPNPFPYNGERSFCEGMHSKNASRNRIKAKAASTQTE